MAAVASPTMTSPVTSPQPTSAPSGIVGSSADAASQAGMSPLVPSPISRRTTLNSRPLSHVSRHRLSQHSTVSNGVGAPANLPPSSLSRPASHLFPLHTYTLPYTIIRDFAYPASNPMHYGPPPEPSEPPSARLSDPAPLSEERMPWESWGTSNNNDLDWDDWAHQPTQFADGPPWSEDEDLQSPVVSSRHRKSKASGGSALGARRRDENGAVIDPKSFDQERGGYYVGTTSDGSKKYYMESSGEANGPGGEYVTYRTDDMAADDDGYHHGQPPRRFPDDGYRSDSDVSSPSSSPYHHEDQSRYSRDYQFTITSPDEEMHGKAVALFDFERENENELPLVEGQIIWVSYRHGQGWLVAKDPKTQENGLVPEAYVRLLRDIEGGMNSLTGICTDSPSVEAGNGTPVSTTTPTTATTTPIVTTVSEATATATATPSTPAEQQRLDTPVGSTGHSPIATVDSNQLHQSPHHGHHPSHHSLHSQNSQHSHHHSTASANGYHQPVVSTFSTSSKDLDPYPTNHLGIHAGQAPPQVVHYHGQRGGSQVGTPVLPSQGDAEQQLLPREALGDSEGLAKQGEPEQAQTGAQEQDQEPSPFLAAQHPDVPTPADDAPSTTTLVQR